MPKDWRKTHPSEDIALEIDARRHLDQRYSIVVEAKDSAFSDVKHVLTARSSLRAAKCNVFYLRDKLGQGSWICNP